MNPSFSSVTASRALSRIARSIVSLSRGTKFAILLTVDVLLTPVSFGLATWISNGGPVATSPQFAGLVAIMTLSAIIASIALGLPRIKLNAYEQTGIQRTAVFAVIVGCVGILVSLLVFGNALNVQFMLVLTMSLIILSVSARLLMRNILLALQKHGHELQRVLIYGAGQTGVQLAAALRTDAAVEPVAFIDDNATLQKIFVAGLPVHSPVRVRKIIDELKVDRVVLAMPSNSRAKQARLQQYLRSLGCVVSILPSFASLVGEGKLLDRIQDLDPSDYLGRAGLDNELEGGCDIYHNSCVMITGAGGSIGSELSRQVLLCRPKRLVLFEVSEHSLYQLDRELSETAMDDFACEIVPVLGSVTDEAHVLRTMQKNGVNTVLHAAAYKHVPMVEANKLPGLYNNVMGTRNVAYAARDAGVGNFILVSTDKAVHPKNVMGASKRLSELLIQDVATRCDNTRFGIVRFGNVLGSSGSVVPLFSEQIARGGPVTLTHNDVTRYFMTLSEAARLVLLVGSQAYQQDEQGEVYVLDMGEPVPIKQLARQMIEGAGYTVRDANKPDGDIELTITGLRPGEKLHEELAMRGHRVTPTSHAKIMRVEETSLSEIEMAAALRALGEALDSGDDDAAIRVLKRWVVAPTLQMSPATTSQPQVSQ